MSRAHAVIEVDQTFNVHDPSLAHRPTISVMDKSSTFGTTVNSKPIKGATAFTVLNEGDVITLGKMKHGYKL